MGLFTKRNLKRAKKLWMEAGKLSMVGRFDEALSLYDRVIEIYPDSEDFWSDRARALHLVGRQQDALETPARDSSRFMVDRDGRVLMAVAES